MPMRMRTILECDSDPFMRGLSSLRPILTTLPLFDKLRGQQKQNSYSNRIKNRIQPIAISLLNDNKVSDLRLVIISKSVAYQYAINYFF